MKGKQTFLSFVHNAVEVSVSMVPTGGGGSSSTGVPDLKIIFLNTAGFSLPKDGGPGAAGLTLDSPLNTGEGGPGREWGDGRRVCDQCTGHKGGTTGYRYYIRRK